MCIDSHCESIDIHPPARESNCVYISSSQLPPRSLDVKHSGPKTTNEYELKPRSLISVVTFHRGHGTKIVLIIFCQLLCRTALADHFEDYGRIYEILLLGQYDKRLHAAN